MPDDTDSEVSPLVFVSYAHADGEWFKPDSLIDTLRKAAEIEGAELWYDKARLVGADRWSDEIADAINRADIAILLVSLDFQLSRYIQDTELPRIEERYDRRELKVMPILVGECDYKKSRLLSEPQLLPAELTPLDQLLIPKAKWDRARNEIVDALRTQIRRVKQRLKEKPLAPLAAAATPSIDLPKVGTSPDQPPARKRSPVPFVAAAAGVVVLAALAAVALFNRSTPISETPNATNDSARAGKNNATKPDDLGVQTGKATPPPGNGSVTQSIAIPGSAVSEQTKLLTPISPPPPLPPPPSTTNFAERVEAAKQWLAKSPQDAEVSARVTKALEGASVETGAGYYLPSVVDKNSGQIWRPLSDICKGAEVPYLCRILMQPHRDWRMPWKAHTFLKYSFRTQEGKRYAINVFPIMIAFSTAGGTLAQRAALDAIAEAPVAASMKWEGLHYAMTQAADAHIEPMVAPFVQFGLAEKREPTRTALLRLLDSAQASLVQTVLQQIPLVTSPEQRSATALILLDRLTTANDSLVVSYLSALPHLTPVSERPQTAERLLDALERVPSGSGLGSEIMIVSTLREWNSRPSAPRLRRILETADPNKSRLITGLLADWNIKDCAPEVQAALERFRYASRNANAVDSIAKDFYTLQGAESAKYLAEVLLLASPDAQRILLNGSLKPIKDKPVTDAIRRLAESSPDPEVRKLAAELVK